MIIPIISWSIIWINPIITRIWAWSWTFTFLCAYFYYFRSSFFNYFFRFFSLRKYFVSTSFNSVSYFFFTVYTFLYYFFLSFFKIWIIFPFSFKRNLYFFCNILFLYVYSNFFSSNCYLFILSRCYINFRLTIRNILISLKLIFLNSNFFAVYAILSNFFSSNIFCGVFCYFSFKRYSFCCCNSKFFRKIFR